MAQDTSQPNEMAARHDPFYDELHASDDFVELRRRYRGFAVPATVLFLAWFLLYVVLSNWATGFMSHRLFGNINVALVFGLLQFLSTFLIAFVYSRYSTANLDPLATKLQDRYEADLAGRPTGPKGTGH
ncbi:DUF485 domain-containing protein [Nocardioides sp.]|uniref:DUF485 domain-containing protein n=1 Tax=Nocardioides sp. TaxID=35761 RepID=UPI00271F829A|nr:DUF485 domain-containing protein [Nocardioides sp.]MDO9455567.1 DUF485 domain-containing protein [Nocardioides sp.]